MTLPQFTEWLGIAHFEYAAVVHRQRVDHGLRDQIAYRLGVPKTQIAEFLPPQPRLRPLPLPAPDGPRRSRNRGIWSMGSLGRCYRDRTPSRYPRTPRISAIH